MSPLAEVSDSTELSREQFKELLTKIDSGLRALPATAQVSCWGLPLGRQLGACQRVLLSCLRLLGNLCCSS